MLIHIYLLCRTIKDGKEGDAKEAHGE